MIVLVEGYFIKWVKDTGSVFYVKNNYYVSDIRKAKSYKTKDEAEDAINTIDMSGFDYGEVPKFKVVNFGENMKEERKMFLEQYKEFYNKVPEKFKHCVTEPEYLDLSGIY